MDGIIGLTTIVLLFGTPTLIAIIVAIAYAHKNRLKTAERARGRQLFERLMQGKLDVIKASSGNTEQVTYNGMPLYLYAKDTKPGDVTGDKVGNVWAIAKP